MIKKLLGLFFVGCMVMLSAHAAPDSDLTQLLQATRSMQADFTQSILNKAAKPIQQSVGRMALQRPGQFLWEVTSPIQQLIVASNKKLWIYDKDLEQVTVRSLKHATGEIPGLLLSDAHPLLKKDFDIQENIRADDHVQQFILKSKHQNNLFAVIQMRFKNQVIDEMQLKDFTGQQTVIQFKNIRINSAIPSSVFHFVPPRGVDVIDESRR